MSTVTDILAEIENRVIVRDTVRIGLLSISARSILYNSDVEKAVEIQKEIDLLKKIRALLQSHAVITKETTGVIVNHFHDVPSLMCAESDAEMVMELELSRLTTKE